MNQVIQTKTDYDEAMERLEELMIANPDEGTAEANELVRLSQGIEVYETKTVKFTLSS